MTIPYLYDAGALIAIDNDDRRMWAIHHLALEEGRQVIVPAVVIGQAWRDSRRQIRLGRFLRSCQIVPVGPAIAKAAGTLCARAGTSDVVDAAVVVMSLARGAIVFTSHPGDITVLAAASGAAVDSRAGLVVRRV